mmetsp:Transcript_658/g.808  ORF Transcript_658/g.808 Transcript_658/m.808 type:complete len:763 (+) Transcript_658:75-2363(+)
METLIQSEMRKVDVELSPEMLSKCVAIAANHDIKPAKLAGIWEAHSMNNNYDSHGLTEANFTSFRGAVLQSVKKSGSNKKKIAVTPASTSASKRSAGAAVVSRPAMTKRTNSVYDSPDSKRAKTGTDSSSQLDQIANGNTNIASPTATVKRERSSGSSVVTPSGVGTTSTRASTGTARPGSSSAIGYDQRKNAGSTVITYNPQNLSPKSKMVNIGNERLCTITQPFSQHLTKTVRHMTDRPRHVHLNNHLQSQVQELIEVLNIPMQLTEEEEHDNHQGQENETVKKDSNNSHQWPPYEHVGVPRQSLQTNVGRICNAAHVGKLNTTTIVLEGTKQGSNGSRIELDVSTLEQKNNASFSLFPGQIVAVSGYNCSGRRMVVERLVEGALPMPKNNEEENVNNNNNNVSIGLQTVKTSKAELTRMQYSQETNCQNGKPITVFAAAGPYTTNRDLTYQPLTDLLEVVMDAKPDVVLLMGPFLDMRQELVKENDGEHLTVEYEDGIKAHVSYEQFFMVKIAMELEGLFEDEPDLKTQFVIVPSLDDAIAEPVYPQPPLEDAIPNGGKIMKFFPDTEDTPYGALGLNKIERAGDRKIPKNPTDRRIHLVSNPSTIQINEVSFGFTSTDTFMHLSTESINHKLPPGTRLIRLAEHAVKQQSYYPIYPPPSGAGKEINLDVTQRDAYTMPVQPDVLVLPSRLTPLATDIVNGDTIAVNPGLLVKGATGGTYAIMEIHPMKKEQMEKASAVENGLLRHNVKDRVRVEVRRI